MMELDSAPSFDWAHDAFVALNDTGTHSSNEKWHPFASSTDSLNNLAFTIPPSLLTQTSVEQRYGQITPPEDLSPAAAELHREPSIPADQVRNEALWPEHQMHALQDYNRSHPQDPKQQQQQKLQEQTQQQTDEPAQSPSHQQDDPEQPSPKRRRSGRQAATNHSPPNSTTPPQSQQSTNASTNPQLPKRKRGRPKSQPQLVEAFTTEGYPFQVSSARQSHLEKNRVAAHKCRQRKKEYINGLESRAREFSTRNKALKENVAMLREEVLELKNEVLRHAGCGFWAVDEYLARCAGDLLGMPPSLGNPGSRNPNETKSPTLSTLSAIQTQQTKVRESTAESLPSEITDLTNEHDDDDDFAGLELLRDFDDDDDDMQDS